MTYAIIKAIGGCLMDVSKEIRVICETLNLSERDLAHDLGVSFETVNRWLNNRKTIDSSNLERLYSYAYEKGIVFNGIYERLYKEEYAINNKVVLFHGAKKVFSMPIDFVGHSKKRNDFGVGFYLGETFEQAANYISFLDAHDVYCFKLDLAGLKAFKFEMNTDWMIAIAYFRGWIDDYKDCGIVRNILEKINDCDVIIAPIADNRMFDIIAEFIEGSITDEQCKHSLAATNLGFQYVLKTEKAIRNATLIQRMFVCEKEKEKCIENRTSLTNSGMQKVRMARIEYKGKGRYFEEMFK